jgi:hypothetical protein
VEYFNYLGSIITNDARCTREMISKIVMAKAAFNRENILFSRKLDLRKTLEKCYIWITALYDAKTWTLEKWIRNKWKVLKCDAGEGWKK